MSLYMDHTSVPFCNYHTIHVLEVLEYYVSYTIVTATGRYSLNYFLIPAMSAKLYIIEHSAATALMSAVPRRKKPLHCSLAISIAVVVGLRQAI